MRSVAGLALTTSSAFLAVVSILIGSPALFYITTAMIATIGACHLQAWLAVRGLRVERIVPESVRVGELITVEIAVWSERRVRRPLITVIDNLPMRLTLSHRSPSLPIAPAFDFPIRTQYQFRALRRGTFRWSGVNVQGTDALGMVTKELEYETSVAEMVILPRPIPVSIDLPVAAGWGISEAESGQTRGAGIEPRGIRQYASGDSLRHVHWRSTARAGQLLVKEFEAGSQASVAILLQRTQGTEIGDGAATTLEQMCGHAVFLAETLLRQGVRVDFPGLDTTPSHYSPAERISEIYQVLATVQADREATVGEELGALVGTLPPGSVVFVMMSIADPSLPFVVTQLVGRGTQLVPMLYDANAFHTARRALDKTPAVDPEYAASLRSAGASPVVIPVDVAALTEVKDERR